MAKIHTTEWTPAILATKAIDVGLNTNWSGPPAHDWLTKLGIWLLDTTRAWAFRKRCPITTVSRSA
jgi:hypothetical protein